MQNLPNQVAQAAKFNKQTVCPNNPSGLERPWRAWLKTDFCSCSWEFATREEGVAYLTEQYVNSPGLDIDVEYKSGYDVNDAAHGRRTYDRVHFHPTFLQNTDTGEVWSLADLGLVPLYWVEPPPPPAPQFFAVAQEAPGRNDEKKFKYTSADAAEKAARTLIKGKGGEVSIWVRKTRQSHSPSLAKGLQGPVLDLYDGGKLIAIVLKDSLDRVWTQVLAGPNTAKEECFL